MKIATGRVISGRIVMEGAPFPEGSTVTILAPEGDGFFELEPREEEELLTAIAEADAGDVIDGEEFLRDLRGRRA
jgi:hypothetical protein